ncbi:MAG TPA: DUF6152 family protein [Vicinamibacterales bacterium]|jgi:hypothetical protein
MRTVKTSLIAVVVLVAFLSVPILAHHSFAMYDQTKMVTLTGVIKTFVPQANHAEIHFILLADDHKSLKKGPDGKPVEWGVEMAGTAQLVPQGITAQTYGAGTVFSVHVHPLRDGSNFGARVPNSAIVKCPVDATSNKPKLPEPGKHCDSVPGFTISGGKTF